MKRSKKIIRRIAKREGVSQKAVESAMLEACAFYLHENKVVEYVHMEILRKREEREAKKRRGKQ